MEKQADVLIIGSGVAALQLAKKLKSDMHVMVITKSTLAHGNSVLAQGGIAAALAEADHPLQHSEDTMEAGRYINNRFLVTDMTFMAPILLQEMLEEGCSFDLTEDGAPKLGLEGAHSYHRIWHGGGDATGQRVMDFLVAETKGAQIIEQQMVMELIMHQNHCVGVETRDHHGATHKYFAAHVVLATGGIGQLYSMTSNASTVTGDGIALAYRAGAEVCDMEFIQFHPTLLYTGDQSPGLISEAVRGEGAKLVLRDGTEIMQGVHPLESLAPRHIVSQTIYDCLQNGNQVFLDVSMIEGFHHKFPSITRMCQEHGIDVSMGLLPVVPGCHFLMGGVKTDEWARTSIAGLYAIGEVACTGVHGANRLASNSLLEGLYFGDKLATYLRSKTRDVSIPTISRKTSSSARPVHLPTVKEIKQRMMLRAGIVRNATLLKEHLNWLESFNLPLLLTCSLKDFTTEETTVVFMVINAWLITKSALLREESRGGHYRSDFPYEDNENWFLKRTILRKAGTHEQTKAATTT